MNLYVPPKRVIIATEYEDSTSTVTVIHKNESTLIDVKRRDIHPSFISNRPSPINSPSGVWDIDMTVKTVTRFTTLHERNLEDNLILAVMLE